MKFLHTADWHIGQLFHEYDRTYEHQQFLNWLTDTIDDEQVDVLLVSGDVFDLSNPSATAVKMFYTFLSKTIKARAGIQIIITAGNHDSASRLESPKPLLESSNIHIVGLVEKDEHGNIDYDRLCIPLNDREGVTKAWCMAVPFLRMGDYPAVADCKDPYAEGVTAFYRAAYEHIAVKKKPGQSIIAMGHLHTQSAEITEMDKAERLIMGGVECVSAAAFHPDIRYVALGHIHKSQRIGGNEHVRYCGSPLPMSFSEINYKHQVIVFDLESDNLYNLKSIEVPVSIGLQRVPAIHSSLPGVLMALQQLPSAGPNPELAPYLEVRVLLDGPEPALRHKIESALKDKHVRLAKIDVRNPGALSPGADAGMTSPGKLDELKPVDVFLKVFQAKYNSAMPEEMLQLFNQVTREVSKED